ncbi:MAG TPA: copper resistance protein NlpE [Arenimonas sp.]|nr:copper resistance protein NlpE [Arenimonas sp.]
MDPLPTTRALRRLPLWLALVLVACGRPEPEAAPPEDAAAAPDGFAAPAAPDGFDRQWFGVLPCSDCDGIQTRLRLQRDGEDRHFELEERYLGGPAAPSFRQQGQWRELERDGRRLYLLDPDGAGLRLQLREDGSLELLGPDGEPLSEGPAYRLGRL